MKIKCPICGSEYMEGTVKFCKVCNYSIENDIYLTNLLNSPSKEDLLIYDDVIREYRELWQEKENQRIKKEQRDKVLNENRSNMILINGGAFLMGSNDGNSDEKSKHEVGIRNFLIGKFVVTQELWEVIMEYNPSSYKGKKLPVERVSWYDAVDFCNKLSANEGLGQAYLINQNEKDSGNRNKQDHKRWSIKCDFNANGYRLPTEAEWEYAARGGHQSKGFIFSGSNKLDDVGWYGAGDKSGNRKEADGTSEVGLKQSNEVGIYDMSGNIWEWCWDWYATYNSTNQINPTGPMTGDYRVARGGSWISPAEYCTVSRRGTDTPADSFSGALGFRVVRTSI